MDNIDINRIAIIGAGPAGICTARHLYHNKHNDKKFDIVIFDQRNQVGGLWNYSKTKNHNGNYISPIYKDLITNFPKQVMNFPDFPYPENYPTFMHHTVVLKYLQDYAKHFSIDHLVRFETEVTTVSPLHSNDDKVENGNDNRFVKWQVESRDLKTGISEIEEFDAVVVCSGVNSKSYSPSIKGSEFFKGNMIHSCLFDDPIDFKDRNVVINGNGPSAIDITVILSKICKKIYLSKRPGGHFKGLHPSNVKVVANVEKINENGSIELEDNSILDADALILCTGYSLSYPFLSKDCKVAFGDNDKVLMPIYKHLFNAVYPSMVFVSLVNFTTTFSLMHQQCAYIAAIYTGHKQLPSQTEILNEIEQDRLKHKAAGKSYAKFHYLAFDSFKYANELAEISETVKLHDSVDVYFKAVIVNTCTDFYTSKLKDYSKL